MSTDPTYGAMPTEANAAPLPSAPAPPTAIPQTSTEHTLSQLIQMMAKQQQTNNQQQKQAFVMQQAAYNREMFHQQARANKPKQRANPPKFQGRPDEDLELWLFHIEEHFAAYATERDSADSRFVDMVAPFLGPDVMSWYREFKSGAGANPRTWFLFKQNIKSIRARFRDSDFEFKLLTKLYELQTTGTQQEYTSKFMLLLSQATIDTPEVVKR